jgi:hypothetical protein
MFLESHSPARLLNEPPPTCDRASPGHTHLALPLSHSFLSPSLTFLYVRLILFLYCAGMELCCLRMDGTVDERLCYMPVHPGWSQPLRHWPATPPPLARNPLPCRRPATPSPAVGRPMRSWTGLAECNSSRSSS